MSILLHSSLSVASPMGCQSHGDCEFSAQEPRFVSSISPAGGLCWVISIPIKPWPWTSSPMRTWHMSCCLSFDIGLLHQLAGPRYAQFSRLWNGLADPLSPRIIGPSSRFCALCFIELRRQVLMLWPSDSLHLVPAEAISAGSRDSGFPKAT